MRNFIKPVFYLLLFTIIPIGFSNCNCKSAIALADLLIKSLEAPNEITVGQAINVVTSAINSEETKECTETEATTLASYIVKVFYLSSGGQDQQVGEFPVKDGLPTTGAGNNLNLQDKFTFNKAGTFRLEYYLDCYYNVQERSEENNGFIRPFLMNKTNNQIGVSAPIVTVLNPNNLNILGPIVEFTHIKSGR